MNQILFIFFTLAFLSCKQRDISQIEVIKHDKNLIDSLKQRSDTSYSTFIGRHDFSSADFYINKKDNIITKIFKDSLENIVGLNKSKAGITLFAAEYYPNGQLIGKTQFKQGMIDGPTIYYYSDGRIKSKGQWHNYAEVGIWKNYKESGELETIIYYDTSGNVVRTDSLK